MFWVLMHSVFFFLRILLLAHQHETTLDYLLGFLSPSIPNNFLYQGRMASLSCSLKSENSSVRSRRFLSNRAISSLASSRSFLKTTTVLSISAFSKSRIFSFRTLSIATCSFSFSLSSVDFFSSNCFSW